MGNMNIDKAQKRLAVIKKYKLANGKDLTVAVRGAEAIYMIKFQLVVILFILSNSVPLREHPMVFLSLAGIFLMALVILAFWHKKIVDVREFMIMKRVYSLGEIDGLANKSNKPAGMIPKPSPTNSY